MTQIPCVHRTVSGGWIRKRETRRGHSELVSLTCLSRALLTSAKLGKTVRSILARTQAILLNSLAAKRALKQHSRNMSFSQRMAHSCFSDCNIQCLSLVLLWRKGQRQDWQSYRTLQHCPTDGHGMDPPWSSATDRHMALGKYGTSSVIWLTSRADSAAGQLSWPLGPPHVGIKVFLSQSIWQ